MTTSPSRVLLLLAALAVTLLATASPAAAHTRLERSEPANEQVVTEPVDQIVLEFNQAVNQTVADIEVTAPDGTTLGDGPVAIDGAIVQRAVAPLPVHGRYTVAYRIVASDGHALPGEVVFDYEGPLPEPEPTPTPEEEVAAATPEPTMPHDEATAEPEPTGGHTEEPEEPEEADEPEPTATPAPDATHDDEVAMSPTAAGGDPPRGRLAVSALVLLAVAAAAAVAIRSLRRWGPEAQPSR